MLFFGLPRFGLIVLGENKVLVDWNLFNEGVEGTVLVNFLYLEASILLIVATLGVTHAFCLLLNYSL